MSQYLHFLSFLMLLLTVGCNPPDKRKTSEQTFTTLTFPDGIFESGCDASVSDRQQGRRVLYYFDGDCALCFGKVKTIESLAVSDLNGAEVVFIAKTTKVDIFRRNFSSAKIKSCIQIDSLGHFELANLDKTYLDQMAVLDSDNHILTEGNLIHDPDVLSAFKKALE